MKKTNWLVAVIMIFAASRAHAYFSDTTEPKNNRVMIGSSFPHSPDGLIALIYQRKVGNNLVAEAGLGGSAAGRHLSVGLNYVWNQSGRFRPLIKGGLSQLIGAGPKTEVFTGGFCPFGCYPDSITYETHSGLFGTIGAGFQFRIGRGWGFEAAIGWTQSLYGGGYKVIYQNESGGDSDNWKGLVKDESTGGITNAQRIFWEF